MLERDLRGVVVVLGSCRAAEAPLRRGGDPLAASLAGAMLAAGARSVLVPSTDVQVGRHLDAGAALHAALAAGKSPAEALWAARRAVARTGDRAAALELLLVQMHGRGH
ncbi:MAG: CHAT domain-containing protein [Planctomycetes bacterium]|nr:CHAT domain-containing protein [Planctomycetota bacterium]